MVWVGVSISQWPRSLDVWEQLPPSQQVKIYIRMLHSWWLTKFVVIMRYESANLYLKFEPEFKWCKWTENREWTSEELTEFVSQSKKNVVLRNEITTVSLVIQKASWRSQVLSLKSRRNYKCQGTGGKDSLKLISAKWCNKSQLLYYSLHFGFLILNIELGVSELALFS